ncbi:hypothetical protein V2J09_012820 [Rumex salicifolius]
MMLQFKELTKLKTKRIVFEDVFKAGDCATLELLKELSAKRRLIEESINQTSSITEAIAREMSGGLTSRHEQDLHKLDQYLPLLGYFIQHVDSASNKLRMDQWISQLKIQWTSALNSSYFLRPRNTTFYQINSLQFERGMCLFLYGGILRDWALEVLSEDLVQAATLFRKAAGVYNYLASQVFPSIMPILSSERPIEVTLDICSTLSLVCLAEAQVVAIKRAEGRGSPPGLLAKLHFGVSQYLQEAHVALQLGCIDSKQMSPQFVDFLSSSKALHELCGYRYLAVSYRLAGQHGIAIGLLIHGLNTAQKKLPEEQAWKLIFIEEINEVSELQKKYEDENNFLAREKVPLEHELPPLERKKIVDFAHYEPRLLEMGGELSFNL